MRSSESSNSPNHNPERVPATPFYRWALPVLTVRVLTGALFVFSGFVKGVDPWGSIIKIGEYFAAWGIEMPGPLIILAAFALGAFEFVWGALLLLGCYKRVSVWMLSAMMLFMLPLSAYIAVADPVTDCGCFGDFLVISNTATFIKNIVIAAALVYLWCFNRDYDGCFVSYVQWIVGGLVTFYILAVELFGYNIQPMLDFRRYAPGTELVAADTGDEDSGVTYIYSKDGREQEFTIDNLPDSTWTFVDRAGVVDDGVDDSSLAVLDEDGNDILEEIIDRATQQFIVTLPDVRHVDLSCTYLLNELNDFIEERGGSMTLLMADGEKGMEWWRDISMATYPIYRADARQLRELARGNAAMVFVDHGRVAWKRAVSSISYTLVTETPSQSILETVDPDCGYWLRLLTVGFSAILLTLFLLDRSGKLIHLHIKGRKKQDNKSKQIS